MTDTDPLAALEPIAVGPCPTCGTLVQVIATEDGSAFRRLPEYARPAFDDEPDCGITGCPLARGHRGEHMDPPASPPRPAPDAALDAALETLRNHLTAHPGQGLDVLRALWPDPLTRPIYTIGDMEMHALRAALEAKP